MTTRYLIMFAENMTISHYYFTKLPESVTVSGSYMRTYMTIG